MKNFGNSKRVKSNWINGKCEKKMTMRSVNQTNEETVQMT